MSIIAYEGFDIFDDVTDVLGPLTNWSRLGTSVSFSKTAGRFGGGAITMAGSNPTVNSWARTFPSVAQDAALYAAFAYKFGAFGATTVTLARFINTNGNVVGTVNVSNTGAITIVDQTGTVVATASTTVNAGIWYWIEIKFIGGSTGSNGTMEVRLNGVVIATAASIDTNNGAFPTNTLSLGPGFGADALDDLVVNNASGSVNNGYLGDLRIDCPRPTADGSTMAWTSSSGTAHNDVDDPLGSSDGDATYISSNTVGQTALFTNGALSGSSASILGVGVRSKAKKNDAGTRTYNNEAKSSATAYHGTAADPGTTYGWSVGSNGNIMEVDPNGSAAWTDAAVNALEVGVRIAS